MKKELCGLCKKEEGVGIKRIRNGWVWVGKKCSKKLGLRLRKEK